MFVTLVIIRLTPFCQIIEILMFYHVYRDTRAYILDLFSVFQDRVGNTELHSHEVTKDL